MAEIGLAEEKNASDGKRCLEDLVGAPLCLEQFLRLAAGMAAALEELHRQNLVHGGLNPRKVFVDPRNGDAALVGGASGIHSLPAAHGIPSLSRQESPAYMSPEQTGRMNRAADCRSDLYSLGVVFYQMLTARLPFEAEDALEWVHCHLARQPESMSDLAPDIPAVVSDIVMKLLAKAAEERYQTATGLRCDLEKCLAVWQRDETIEPFALGQGDIPDRLLIPHKLYGRERDLDTLHRIFARVVAEGTPEIVLVAGYSGIGKTSLVNELRNPVECGNGVFIAGKFDQYTRNVPYATIAQTFRELIQRILTGSEETIAEWRERFQSALGANAQLVIDLIPQLELILGKQPPVPPLAPAENRNRFRMVFQQFVGAFAQKEHPLVLFLDDLQWADPASLQLLEDFAGHPETRHLLLIGAYRDNEVTPTHPMMLALDNLRKKGARLLTLTLGPLSQADLGRFLADTLRTGEADLQPLTALIHAKTAGNPFFVIRFLMALHDEGLVAFDGSTGRWHWDIGQIQAKGYTDNVADLMVARLKELPVRTQMLLRLASCVGTRFEVNVLAALSRLTPDQVAESLLAALRDSLVYEAGEGFCCFAHDRVQQAANALLDDDERERTHLRIGRILLGSHGESERQEYLFEIVEHFDSGLPAIDDPAERRKIAALNLEAAKKALLSTAYRGARQFALAAWQLVDPVRDWTEHYGLLRQLYGVLAESEFMNGNLARCKELICIAIGHLETNLEKAEFYNLLIVGQTLEGACGDAVESGRAALALLGIELPLQDPELAYRREVEEIDALVGDRPLQVLLEAKPLQDPRFHAAQSILLNVDVPAYISCPALYPFIIAKMVHISLLHGNSQESCKSYCNYGMLLGAFFGQYRRGYEFARLGWELVGKLDAQAAKCKTTWPWAATQAWVMPLRDTFQAWEDGIRAGLETGDLQFVGYDLATLVHVRYIAGEPLPQLDIRFEHALEFTRGSNQWAQDTVSALRFASQALRTGDTQARISQDEADYVADCTQRGNLSSLCFYYCYRAQRLILGGATASALEFAEQAQATTGNVLGSQLFVEANFFHSLALVAMLTQGGSGDRCLELEGKLAANQERLQLWRDACPANVEHKFQLVCAERARAAGQALEAMDCYERAIMAAREQGFVQDEGLAYTLAAAFYRARGFAEIADTYLRSARNCFDRWGAKGLVDQLTREHPQIYRKRQAPDADTQIGLLDAVTVLKASQAISGKIVQADLVETLMRIVIENAGAETGCLVLAAGDELVPEAMARVEGGEISVFPVRARPLESLVPASMANYAKRTRECVILGDATEQNMFSADSYLIRQRPLSVLCLPMLRQKELIGLLYLENNLAKGVFTQDRLAVLEVLAAQAAISLENAVLYEKLKQNQNLLHSIIDNTKAVIFVKKTSGQYLLINHHFEELFHVDRAGIIGKTDHDIFPAEAADAFRAFDQRVLAAGAVIESEEAVPHDDGLHTYISVKSPLFDKDGRPYAVCGISTDITKRKQDEVEIRRLNAELLRKIEELQDAQEELLRKGKLSILGQLAGSVGHEIRNPLGVMSNAVYYLKMVQPEADDSVKEYLDIIQREIDNCQWIITDLLDFARTRPPQPLVTSAGALISDSLARCTIPGNVEPSIAVPGDLPPVRVDPRQIGQVLQNLIVNAVQAMPEGGELIISAEIGSGASRQPAASPNGAGASSPECLVSGALGEPHFVIVRVADTGHGISPQNMKKLFQPLFTTKPKGIGLGLVVCKSLVSANGGQIGVESEAGRGAAFCVALPICSREDGGYS